MLEIDDKNKLTNTELPEIGLKLFDRTIDILRKSDDFKNSLFEHFAIDPRNEPITSLRIGFMNHDKCYELLRATTTYNDRLYITKEDKGLEEGVVIELTYQHRGKEKKVNRAVIAFSVYDWNKNSQNTLFQNNHEAEERIGKFLDELENG